MRRAAVQLLLALALSGSAFAQETDHQPETRLDEPDAASVSS